MLAFLRFERRRLFGEKKNLIFLGFIALFSAYFTWSGLNEFRQFQVEKEIFIKFEKEKISQIVNYSQYGAFGFRLLYEPSPLNLFFVNSSVLQDVESNIDSLEAIKMESSFKGKKLFLKRGYFKDFAGIPFIFGSLFMLYMGHLALVGPAYLRFMSDRMPLKKFYRLTTAARLFWLDLYFVSLGLGSVLPGPTRRSVFFRAGEKEYLFYTCSSCCCFSTSSTCWASGPPCCSVSARYSSCGSSSSGSSASSCCPSSTASASSTSRWSWNRPKK